MVTAEAPKPPSVLAPPVPRDPPAAAGKGPHGQKISGSPQKPPQSPKSFAKEKSLYSNLSLDPPCARHNSTIGEHQAQSGGSALFSETTQKLATICNSSSKASIPVSDPCGHCRHVAAWVPHNLVFPQTQSSESQNGGASAIPVALATAASSTGLQNSTRDSDPAALNTLVSAFYGLLIIKILMLIALLPRCIVGLGANGAENTFCLGGSEQEPTREQRVERPSLTSFSCWCEHTRSPHGTFRRKKLATHSHTHTLGHGAHPKLGLLDPPRASSSLQL
ncbi:LOW QUALITY PROTEIN: uncharacterized protein LOC121677313 [Arvicola amphibius]|uniref:LOW QUALITY PROTEIN: uncharacterized protein LOC121677313 n=1 Tax=Arvicola amphibius TaxID=1047088 RepID=UPI001C080DC0|nr:LOW QUALITY PROTEIN: uncharacterized protein LOC121677313 [Arvicola amphibius]